MLIDIAAYLRRLGHEIHKLRKQRGWTRKHLKGQLKSDISEQTLATYELGTRQISVVRLVEICLALGERPQDLLGRVHEQLFADSLPVSVMLNLQKIVMDQQPELLPLRRWAAHQLAHRPHTDGAQIPLMFGAVQHLAFLCGVEEIHLVGQLRRFND